MASQDDEVGGPRPRDQWAREQERALERVREPHRPGALEAEAGPERHGPSQQLTREPRQSRGGGGDGDAALRRDPGSIRAEDTEPYIGLQYVARLFKIVAMIVIVAIIAEVVAGLIYEGMGAGFNLLAEVIQGGVLAAMLWGAGDLTLLFIDVGHDVRAARVLLGRMSARMGVNPGDLMPHRERDEDDVRPAPRGMQGRD
ncbi:hypothetical protein [Longimicrobium sp.]|uniref:hypothetical protein n=1 Tax=Longimicrobium sp. TaxID=2029185 RepID=UPI003B3A630F